MGFDLKTIYQALEYSVGRFTGTGNNHEGQTFAGTLVFETILGGRGFQIKYLATGVDGELYHAEHSMICPDADGHLCLWNLNTNAPGLICHRLTDFQSEPFQLDFTYGDLDALDTFRERIRLGIDADGSLFYGYAWGLPGGDFAERSGLILKR